MERKKTIKVEEVALYPTRTFRNEATDPATVAEYAGLMEQGVKFPPLTVACVGKKMKRILVGGAHRLAAATKAKITEIEVTFVTCKTALDAELLTFTDNVAHGLQLTAEEKRKAIIEMLQVPAMKKLSNAAAAKRLGVSDMSIKRYRDAMGTKSPKAAQSGHKNQKSNVAPKIDKGGKTIAATDDPVSWKVQGAMLGGGAKKVADAIIEKITEGCSAKQPDTWAKRVEFLDEVTEIIEVWISKQ